MSEPEVARPLPPVESPQLKRSWKQYANTQTPPIFAEVCFGKWAGDKVKITANGRKYFEANAKAQPRTNKQS